MRKLQHVLMALMMLTILYAAPLYALAAEEQDNEMAPAADSSTFPAPEPEHYENTVFDEAGLAEWFYTHASTGGTVTLGANITITSGINFNGNFAITIDTGAFGLTYNGGCIFPSYMVSITGEGVDVPVLDVVDPNVFRMNWIHTIQELYITATGRNGEGGTALRISQADSTWRPNLDYFLSEGLIRSYGIGAVGVELGVPLDVYCLNIQTEGDGSVAVLASEGGADLYYCKLSASGIGAVAVRGGDIVLDRAKTVMREEYPDLKINLQLPDEKSRRVGQSVAAASLPKIIK
jgi:hypothetical protein